MSTQIITVKNKSDKKRFIKSQWNFYKGDPNFVPPLIMERKKVLDTEKNPLYMHSKIELFMAEREGQIVGRIAAIINGNHNKTHNDKVGFFGFFECENNQETANLLLKTAENWLKERGFDQMRGPINPTMNDEVGLLSENFDQPPVILTTYNPKYYIDLLEGYGLENVKNLLSYWLSPPTFITPKLERLQDIIKKRNSITVREINFKDKKQFAKDVELLKGIYNTAWQPNWGFVKMTDEEFDALAADFKQFADSKYSLIVEVKGKPAGFLLALPDLNQVMIHNKKGSLLGAGWHLLTKKKQINVLRIIVLGLIPEYQKTGADAVLYFEVGKRAGENGIEWAEASWILEDNEMMNKGLTQTMNAKHYKTHRIYQKDIV